MRIDAFMPYALTSRETRVTSDKRRICRQSLKWWYDKEILIMNKKQKVIRGVVLVIIALLIVFPQITLSHPDQEYYDTDTPITRASQYMTIFTIGYGFILRDYAAVNYTVLAFRCLIIGGVGGLLIYAVKEKKPI
ncbi:MAG: hypothetical protein ACYSR9_09885 [Planctomycetota bacterium]|jgi:hypothetical protein